MGSVLVRALIGALLVAGAAFWTERGEAKDPGGPRYKLGISLAELDNVVRVTNVNPGSLGDQMGFKVNDVVDGFRSLEDFAAKLPPVNAVFTMTLRRPPSRVANAPSIVYVRGKIVPNDRGPRGEEYQFQRIDGRP